MSAANIWNLYETIHSSIKVNNIFDLNINVNDIEYKYDEKNNCENSSIRNSTNDLSLNMNNSDDIMNKKPKNNCEYCGEIDSLMNDGEMIVCTSCGSENNRIIDYNPEWRFYGSDDNKRNSDPNRCGMPNNQIISESSLSTVILGRGFEIYRKLNTWNGLTYKEKSMISILNKIAAKANID